MTKTIWTAILVAAAGLPVGGSWSTQAPEATSEMELSEG